MKLDNHCCTYCSIIYTVVRESQIIEVLNLLLAQSTLNLNAVDDRKVFPLIAVVNMPNTHLATQILERLSSRGVWWEQTDQVTGESALDKAVKRDKVDIFIALIRLGAGILPNVDATQAFMEKYIKQILRWLK